MVKIEQFSPVRSFIMRSGCALRTFPKEGRQPNVAYELFEIQTKTCINNSLHLIDILLDQDPSRGRDSTIHEQIRLIRELVELTRYVRFD
jgi:hypothetical protein